MKRKTQNAHNSPGGAPPPTSLEPKTKKTKPESRSHEKEEEEATEDHTRTDMKRKHQPSSSSVQNQEGLSEEKKTKHDTKPERIVSRQRLKHGRGPQRKMQLRDFERSETFPTPEEEEFFTENVITSNEPHFRRHNSQFLIADTVRMKFVNLDKVKDNKILHQHVAKLLDIFIRRMLKKAGGNLKTTKYWLQLNHDGYTDRDGFFVTHKTYAVADGGVIMNEIAKQMQSNKELRLDESFTVAMNVFKDKQSQLRGRGTPGSRKSDKIEKIRKTLLKQHFGVSLCRITGTSHCLPKAFALGKLESDIQITTNVDQKQKMEKFYRSLVRPEVLLDSLIVFNMCVLQRTSAFKSEAQEKLARQLLVDAGMDVNKKEHDRKDLVQLANYLSNYQIILWTANKHQAVPTEEKRFNPDGKGFIGLFYYEGHYEHVNHTKGKQASRFCFQCSTFDDNQHCRRCKAKCKRCGATGCKQEDENIHCSFCNIYFRSKTCFDAHLTAKSKKGLSQCKKYSRCEKCNLIDRSERIRGETHVCNAKAYCSICREKALKGHTCAHHVPDEKEKLRKRENQKQWAIIVYDMECIVAESGLFEGHIERGPKHKPNFICVRMICSDCRGEEGCQLCAQPWTYSYKNFPPFKNNKHDSPLASFADFLLHNPRAAGAYVIAHNGGRYDHVMLLAELDRQGGTKAKEPKILLNGMTIITAEFEYEKRKLHFRDSFQYLQMGLAKMPGAFGLEGEAKGFFPHLYNHPDNYDKELKTLPAKEYYSPQFMAPSTKKEFDDWYEKCYHDGFKLHDELLKYCQSDVRILTLTLMSFIEMCEATFNGWNPIVNGCTIASYVMFVLKHEYIKKGDVGYVPENGYGGGNNSMLALKYIQWLEKIDPTLHLKYKLRGGEVKIEANGHSYFADAFNETTNEVFEIYGCVWHGCPKCYPDRDKKCPMRPDKTMEALYKETMKREEDILNKGFNLNSVWECEIYKEMEQDREMQKFFELNKYDQRLKPREALYGGRTQAFRSMAAAIEDILLNYYDFNSLYPYLNAGGTAYPRGNPIVVDKDFPNTDEPLKLKGIVFCDVLPTQDAAMGYLPQKIMKKLMFVLCRTCANNQNIEGKCTHTKVSERFLTGVWCTDELNKAVSKGYKVLKYHEIWHWPEDAWVKGGFFADYIKPLLKLKHESSGWPKENMTDEEKKAYIARIWEMDGVKLDPLKIIKNKALRSLCKIFLNSAWGKFAQNPMKVETRLIYNSDGLAMANFFNDPNFEPTGLLPYGEHKHFISRKPKKDFLKTSPFTNLAIAAITTCAARLRLTEAIERVGIENMIYCDTDSVIFKQKKDSDPLGNLKGDNLGYLTNEIPPGNELVEAVAMAPKVYALKIRDKNGNYSYTVKAKGMCLNSGNTGSINFDTMKER
ncbi:hypothetical protein CRE_07890 [Caenorhabditis remanei]|uniref:DNA-directed DNA polymerase n=1 Tax=Caenorhabditis remanei TaxID=31234 RepID=E3NLW1_CAERE|nr:hypothetical protein CRE_07890 [Caenorhabditis remanei]